MAAATGSLGVRVNTGIALILGMCPLALYHQFRQRSESANRELRREADLNALLIDVLAGTTELAGTERLPAAAAEALARAFPTSWTALFLADDNGRVRMRGPEAAPGAHRPRIDSLLIQTLTQTVRTTNAVSDLGGFGITVPVELADHRVALAVPVRSPVGLLLALDRNPGAFGWTDVAFVEALADHLAGAFVRAQTYATANTLSMTDPLTNLLNRRAFDDHLDVEIDRTQRYRVPFTVVLLEVDGLDEVRHQHGHGAVDAACVHTAQLLSSAHLRRGDAAFRIDGQRFAVLLAHTNADLGGQVAERLRTRIASHSPVAIPKGPSVRLSVSVGVAACPQHATDAGSLLERADIALRTARRSGDRVVIYAPSLSRQTAHPMDASIPDPSAEISTARPWWWPEDDRFS